MMQEVLLKYVWHGFGCTASCHVGWYIINLEKTVVTRMRAETVLLSHAKSVGPFAGVCAL